MGKIIKTKPSEKDLEEEKFDFSFVVVVATSENMGSIQQKIENISEIKKLRLISLSSLEKLLMNMQKMIQKKRALTKQAKVLCSKRRTIP